MIVYITVVQPQLYILDSGHMPQLPSQPPSQQKAECRKRAGRLRLEIKPPLATWIEEANCRDDCSLC